MSFIVCRAVDVNIKFTMINRVPTLKLRFCGVPVIKAVPIMKFRSSKIPRITVYYYYYYYSYYYSYSSYYYYYYYYHYHYHYHYHYYYYYYYYYY